MMGSGVGAGRPVRFNERTGRGVLERVGYGVAVALVGGIAFGLGSGWPSYSVAYFFCIWLLAWSANTLAGSEWGIAGHELRRRPWFSRPGSLSKVEMELGPEVELVHESWGRWRLRDGPARSGPAIPVWPTQTALLVGAVESAGVHVNDWRGAWARRHRRLDLLGMAAAAAGVAALLGAAAIGIRTDNQAGGYLFLGSIGALITAWAIDYLPWTMSKQA